MSETFRDLPPETALEVVRSSAGFRAFCYLLDTEIRAGRSAFVFHALTLIGAAPNTANAIVEGWPLKPGALCRRPDVNRQLEAALWLACSLVDMRRVDWPAIMARVVPLARERAEAGRL